MIQEDFLRQQGATIATEISKRGYQVKCIHGSDLIAWEVSRSEDNYWVMMAWLPRPVAQWRLLPVAHDDRQSEIYAAIEAAIDGRR